jgi:regulatory LuxR family protein
MSRQIRVAAVQAAQPCDRRAVERRVLGLLDRIELGPGSVNDEAHVGTNAIGTAIAQRVRRQCRLSGGRPVAIRARWVEDNGVPLWLDPPAPTGGRARGQPLRHRPVTGWASLTDTERGVAAVITEGLTNREAAARLYLSRHTIDF